MTDRTSLAHQGESHRIISLPFVFLEAPEHPRRTDGSTCTARTGRTRVRISLFASRRPRQSGTESIPFQAALQYPYKDKQRPCDHASCPIGDPSSARVMSSLTRAPKASRIRAQRPRREAGPPLRHGCPPSCGRVTARRRQGRRRSRRSSEKSSQALRRTSLSTS